MVLSCEGELVCIACTSHLDVPRVVYILARSPVERDPSVKPLTVEKRPGGCSPSSCLATIYGVCMEILGTGHLISSKIIVSGLRDVRAIRD